MENYKVNKVITFFNGSEILETEKIQLHSPDELQDALKLCITETMKKYKNARVDDVRFYGLEKVEYLEVKNILPEDIREQHILKIYHQINK
jgi:predicted nucleic acid-binding protein